MAFPELTALKRHLERSDPDDPKVQALNLSCLHELIEFVKEHDEPDLASCLNAAGHLLRTLSGSGQSFERREVRDLACRLLDSVERSLTKLGWSADSLHVEPAELRLDTRADTPGQDAEPPAAASSVALPSLGASPPQSAPAPAPLETTVSDAPLPNAAGTGALSGGAPKTLPQTQGLLLGEMMVQMGKVSRDEVDRALELHRSSGMPLGECLLMQGAASPAALLETLDLQQEMRHGATLPSKDKVAEARSEPNEDDADANIDLSKFVFLGEVLLGAGMISKENLEKAMHIHHLRGIPTGQALLEVGALTEEALERGLELQRSLRHVTGLAPAVSVG